MPLATTATAAAALLTTASFASAFVPTTPPRAFRSAVAARATPSSHESPPWAGSLDPDANLVYMDFWRHQQSLLEGELGARRVELSEDMALQTNEKMGARIASAEYETDDFRKIRMTYFDAGKKVQVYNSLWYPRNDLDAPVLGIDLLCFGGAKLLAVIDCQPLQPKGDATFRPSACTSFEKIRAAYPSLQGKMSSRFYDEDTFFSDAMLYGRYEDAAPVATDVLPALKEYMSAYLAMIGRTQRSEGSEEVARVVSQQKEYDQYSADHDPAHALFTSYFGADWADEYVHDFLFDMSERKEKEAVKEVAVA
eukprot:CAMPEP_0182534092 /NCGR_PEP_ID=MMETSP1323-20130603/15051_1 /TAXON_ID=236787 /ORGANISM="Florenciella parvula, Strain RCC1693" /LENGTH=309 /DNA_ID=CAMNT_0024744065 /DNA_START=39 /DNA_END=964 /DNA_ORIENTATION=+